MSKSKKQTNLGLIISAALITALLFAAGLAIGYSLNTQRLTEIEQRSQEMAKAIQNFQLQFFFLDVLGKDASCPVLNQIMNYTVTNYEQIGGKLANKELEDYSQYQTLLRDYYLASINYWLLAKKLKQDCDFNYSTILFFISKSCDKYVPNPCDDQAFILTYLKQQMDENLLIFTISSDIQEPAIQALVNYYNITQYPTVTINEKVYAGFQDLETLKTILG